MKSSGCEGLYCSYNIIPLNQKYSIIRGFPLAEGIFRTTVVSYINTTFLCIPLSFLKSKASSLSVTISFMLIILWWLSCRRILISRMAVIGKPSFSLSNRTFFSATISPTREFIILLSFEVNSNFHTSFNIMPWDHINSKFLPQDLQFLHQKNKTRHI